MRQVVTYVAEDTAAIDICSGVPVPYQDVGESPEGYSEHEEHDRRHDEAHFVHCESISFIYYMIEICERTYSVGNGGFREA